MTNVSVVSEFSLYAFFCWVSFSAPEIDLLFSGCWTYWKNFLYAKATASQDLMVPPQATYASL